MNKKIAIIDTETNWDDVVMSIGIVIADSRTYKIIDGIYFIIDPEYKVGGMFSYSMHFADSSDEIVCARSEAIDMIVKYLKSYDVKELFAYNACFDYNHLKELCKYKWYDIMRIAAYTQYNEKIPKSAVCCNSGRLKSGYGVESMYRLLSGQSSYSETHNALYDAVHELEIMEMLGLEVEIYECARIDR